MAIVCQLREVRFPLASERRAAGSHDPPQRLQQVSTLNNKERFVTDYVTEQLTKEFTTCAEAFNDVVRWCILLYGDWYGNRGGNTLVYYFNYLLMTKVPNWVALCYLTTNMHN